MYFIFASNLQPDTLASQVLDRVTSSRLASDPCVFIDGPYIITLPNMSICPSVSVPRAPLVFVVLATRILADIRPECKAEPYWLPTWIPQLLLTVVAPALLKLPTLSLWNVAIAASVLSLHVIAWCVVLNASFVLHIELLSSVAPPDTHLNCTSPSATS